MIEAPSAIGSIERDGVGWVRGTLIGDAPIAAPLSGRPCWYYKIVVEMPEDGVGWTRLAYEARGQSFEIDDGTGIALIDPEGAQVEVDYDRRFEVAPGARVVQAVAELVRRFRLPEGLVVLREGVLAVGEVVAVHGRLVPERDPDPTRGGTRVRVTGAGRERVFVSELPIHGWATSA
ncbi:MAG: hypothetical protein IPL61_18450 [Myxococcales bacterium]|nr:hypothetical protein [Myxococcales bacterium]